MLGHQFIFAIVSLHATCALRTAACNMTSSVGSYQEKVAKHAFHSYQAYGHGLFVGIKDFGSDGPFAQQTCCWSFHGNFWVKGVLEVIVRQRAPFSFNMSSHGATWTNLESADAD